MWKCGNLEIWNSGILEFWKSGNLEFWNSGILEFWKSGILEFWNSKIWISEISEFPTEFWNSVWISNHPGWSVHFSDDVRKSRIRPTLRDAPLVPSEKTFFPSVGNPKSLKSEEPPTFTKTFYIDTFKIVLENFMFDKCLHYIRSPRFEPLY